MIELLVRRRKTAAALLGLVCLALLPGLTTAGVPDNALKVWFLETDPGLVAYEEFHREFGNDEVVLLYLEPPGGVFSTTGQGVIEAVSARLTALEGVARVHSILTARDAWKTDDGLRFDLAIEGGEDRLAANPLFTGRLVSPDGAAAMLWVEPAVMDDFDARRDAIVGAIRATVDEALAEHPHALGGVGVIYSGLNLVTQRDFGVFVGLSYLVIFGALWWIFRTWRLVAAIGGVVTVGTIASLGALGLAGKQINMITVVLPTLVIVLGLADALHFPAAFAEARASAADTTAATVAALKKVVVPCLMTTLTTMAGFLALVSSPMAVIRDLGLYAALGVGAALVASIVLMATVLPSLPDTWTLRESRLVQGQLRWIRGLLDTRRPALVALSVGIAGVAAYGALQVVTDTYTIGYLPDDHVVVTDHEAMEERWGDYSVIDFLVRPDGDRRVDSAEVLEATLRFEEAATALPGVRDGYGLHTVYRRMADVLGADVPDDEPLSPKMVAQLSLLLEIQALEWDRDDEDFADNFLAPLRTEDAALGRLTLVGEMPSAKEIEVLLADLEGLAATAMGDLGTIEPAGYPPLYAKIVEYAMSSQIRGFFGALVIIFTLMLVWLRSPRLALITLVPNVFPVLVMMGVMGAAGIHLDIATATVAAIVIGVSIDDSVHFLIHWRRAEVDGMTWAEAVEHTHRHAGLPAVLTTLLLVLGYPVLMLAQVKTVISFGLLTTVAAAAALFADLVILPLLLRAWPSRSTPR